MSNNVSIAYDKHGKKVILINEIIFHGKRNIDWKEVKSYLRSYVGQKYTIEETSDIIYLGSDLPEEDQIHTMFFMHHFWSVMIETKQDICMI